MSKCIVLYAEPQKLTKVRFSGLRYWSTFFFEDCEWVKDSIHSAVTIDIEERRFECFGLFDVVEVKDLIIRMHNNNLIIVEE
jgi:hypothetical protein